ncbi:MAG: hypothetical protein WA667_02485 [Candidatus Nitrosopolaris sp.]
MPGVVTQHGFDSWGVPLARAKILFRYRILELREREYFDCTNITNRILNI